jgi:vesicle coat complex subunit
VDIKGDVDEAIEKIEEKLAEYTLSILKRDGKKIKFKIEKDLFKQFLNQIKKYKEGLVPEDISKEEDE